MDVLTIGDFTLTLHPVVLMVLAVAIGLPLLVWFFSLIAGFVMLRRQHAEFMQDMQSRRIQRR